MTLHYIDPDSDMRMNPRVPAPDVQLNPMGHATTSISPRAQGTQGVGRVTTKDSKIIANDGSNNVGLIGFDDAGKMVIKVAKQGFDANSAPDDQLIFDSSRDIFKIVETGKATLISPGSSNQTVTLTADFTNVYTSPPLVLCFVAVGMGYTALPYFNQNTPSGGIVTIAYSIVVNDVSTTGIDFLGSFGSGFPLSTAYDLSYFVIQESIQ